jgi:hypothetical protein
MPRPNKIIWPIGFEEMLVFALPQKRRSHREKFYRLFLRDFLHPHTNIRAPEVEIKQVFRADCKRKFQEPEADRIKRWINMSLEKWKSEHFRNRATTAGRKSWSKKARKKRVENFERKMKNPP